MDRQLEEKVRTAQAFGPVHFTEIAQSLPFDVSAEQCRRRAARRGWHIPGQTPTHRQIVNEPTTSGPVSPEELCQLHGIDLEDWMIVSTKVNRWEVGAKAVGLTTKIEGAVKDGFIVQPLYQTAVTLKRNNIAAMRDLQQDLLADIAQQTEHPRTRGYSRPPAGRHMLEVAVMDAHVGLLAWGKETGQSYDLEIVDELFLAAIEDLLDKASGFDIERILFPIGNDLVAFDNLDGATTAGTRQDADSRYYKVFRRARLLCSEGIRLLSQVAPVLAPVIPGNHDRLAAFHIGEVLAAEFQSDEFVEIDNRPNLRKYVEYGANLIGFTHGQNEKLTALPLIMAGEQKEAWSRTTFREWHLGHFHRKREYKFLAGEQIGEVMVRILPSLVATDAWHYEKGYGPNVSGRRSEAYVWHAETGYVGHFSANVGH